MRGLEQSAVDSPEGSVDKVEDNVLAGDTVVKVIGTATIDLKD